jgi:flavin-dependent dehydrogenase
MVEEAGLHAMPHRQFVTPVMDGDRVAGILVDSRAGHEAIMAKVVIDAAGGADVAHRAGAPHGQDAARADAGGLRDVPSTGVDKPASMAGVDRDPQTYAD